MGYEVQVNSPVYPALTMLHLLYCVIVYPTLTCNTFDILINADGYSLRSDKLGNMQLGS